MKLTGLTSLMGTKGINIIDTGGSTLLDANVATLSGVSITTDGTDARSPIPGPSSHLAP